MCVFVVIVPFLAVLTLLFALIWITLWNLIITFKNPYKLSVFFIVVEPITQYTHVRNKISNTQGSSPNMVECDFPYLKELLL